MSYCATAMSRLTRATSRLARLRPASKIGSRICGAKLQPKRLSPTSPSSSVLAMPMLPVSVMRGKNAARAAPMLALAARSCCSAWRMSGRRSSRSDGRPAAISGASVVAASGGPAGRSGGSGRRRAAAARSRRARAGAAAGRARRARSRAATRPAGSRARRRRPGRTSAWSGAANPRAWRASGASGEQLVVGEQRQVGGGDAGDQADLHARRASPVAANCASAASPRFLMRPNRSSS